MLNDQKIKGMKAGDVLFETDKRNPGAGSLMFRRLVNGISVSLRYSVDGKRQFHPVGNYKLTADSQGMTLRELRDEHKRLADLRKDHPDLKVYFEQQEFARLESERLAKIEASKGSFDDLFSEYIADREAAGMSAPGVKELRNMKRRNLDIHPELMAMRACDIGPVHINQVLTPLIDREVYRQAMKMRSYLHAAFAFGLKYENIAGRASTKVTFGIHHNPVTVVGFEDEHSQKARRVGTRALTDRELRRFYHTCGLSGSGISYAMGQLFRMVIATGGQRISQLCREPWESYQKQDGTGMDYICIADRKGRGGVKRLHLVPHTERTRQILADLDQVTGEHKHPFSAESGSHFDVSSFSQAINRWLETDHAVIDGKRMEPFTPRDLRRTVARLMQRHQIPSDARNELQSHGLTDVVARHYENDPEETLPGKQVTMQAVERILKRVLDDQESVSDNVIQLRKV